MPELTEIPEKIVKPLRQRRFVIVLEWVVLISCTLFLFLYFVLQSEWLYRSIIFPRVARNYGGTISVGAMNIKPWSLIELGEANFKDRLGNTNTISELKFRYALLPLLSGKAILEELHIKNASINLDHFLKKDVSAEKEAKAAVKQNDPELLKEKSEEIYPNLSFLYELKKVSFANVDVTVAGNLIGYEKSKAIHVNKINFKIDDFQSNSGGDVEFALNLITDTEQSALPSYLEANLKTNIQLHPDRQKIGLKFNVDLNNLKGKFRDIPLDDVSVSLKSTLDFTLKDLTFKDVSIKATTSTSPILTANGSGKINFTDKTKYSSSTFDLKIDALHNEILNFTSSEPTIVEDGVLSGHLTGTSSQSKGITTNATLKLENLRLLDSPINKRFPATASLSFNIKGKDTSYVIDSSALEIRSEEKLLGNAKFVGSIDTIDSKTLVKGDLASDELAIDKIFQLFPKSEKKKEEKNYQVEEVKAWPVGVDLQVKLANASYLKARSRDAYGAFKFEEGLLKGDNIEMFLNDGPLKASFIITLAEPMYKPTVDVDFRDVEIKPLLESYNVKTAEDLSGRLQRFTFKVKNSRSPDKVNETERDGDFRAIFKNLKIPAYLQDTPPINLIFLPIDAIGYLGGQLSSWILPEEVVEVADSLEEERAGQVEFEHAQFQGLINREGVTFGDTKLNSYVLPTFTFYGTIGFDESLDLVIGIELLKVPIPLPVTGSMSFPLPDLPGFVPAVVRSLGMSVLNIGAMFESDEELETMFFEGNDEEDEDEGVKDEVEIEIFEEDPYLPL